MSESKSKQSQFDLADVAVFIMLQGKMKDECNANSLMGDILQIHLGKITFSAYVENDFAFGLVWGNYSGKSTEIETRIFVAAAKNGVKKMSVAITIPCIKMSKFRYFKTFCCKHVIFTNNIENFDELGDYVKNSFTNYVITKTAHGDKYKNGYMIKCSNANCGGILDESLVTNLMKLFPESRIVAISKCNKNYGTSVWGYS